MSNLFTLDSMREEIEREFAPVSIDIGEGTVVLRNVLRIPKKRRDEVFALITELEGISPEPEKDEDGNEVEPELDLVQMEQMSEISLKLLGLVADNDALGTKLVAALEDDLALTMKVFEAWMTATKPGEAEGSPA